MASFPAEDPESYFKRVSEALGFESSQQISLTAKDESPEEMRSRLKLEEAEAEFQRKMREVEAEYKRRIPYEPPEVMQSRLRREEAEAESQRKIKEAEAKNQQQLKSWSFLLKDASAYAVGILLVIALVGSSIYFLIEGDPTRDDKKQEFARSTLALIGGAVAGYVFGRSGSGAANTQTKD